MPYIAIDPIDDMIWGTGTTSGEALNNAQHWINDWLKTEGVNYILGDPDNGVWDVVSRNAPAKIKIYEATEKLVQAVKDNGYVKFSIKENIADLPSPILVGDGFVLSVRFEQDMMADYAVVTVKVPRHENLTDGSQIKLFVIG